MSTDNINDIANTIGTTPEQLKQMLSKVGIGNLVKNVSPDKLAQLTKQGGIQNLMKNLSPQQTVMLNKLSRDPNALNAFLSSGEAQQMINQIMNK